jgi:hypothetical protein
LDELFGGVRGRFVDQNGTSVPFQAVDVGIGLQQGRAVTEIALGMPQRRQHQAQLLAVIGPPAQRRGGLDEQDLAMGVLTAVNRRAELVGEEPQRCVIAGGHDLGGTPRRLGWHVRADVGFRSAAGDPGSTTGCGAAW